MILGCDVLCCVSLCLDMELVVGYVECSFPIAFRADRGMNGPVPWGSGKKVGVAGPANQNVSVGCRTHNQLTPPPPSPSSRLLSLHTQHYRPHFLVSGAYQSTQREGRT